MSSPHALAVVDAVAKLALPTSMLLLVQGWSTGAVAAAAIATGAAALRGFVSGLAVESSLLDAWRRVADATRTRAATELTHRDLGSEGAAMLFEGIEAESSYRANVVPRLVSLSVSALLVAGAVVAMLGARWLLAGAFVFAVMGGLVRIAQRRVGAAHQKMVDCYGPLSVDLNVALDAALELRAQAAEGFVDARIRTGARMLARQRRTANTWSAVLALLPLAVAALALAGPAQAGLPWVRQTVEQHAPEAGILGATAAVLGVGLARALEEWTALRPARAKLDAFLRAGARTPEETSREASRRPLNDEDPIQLRAVEHHYPDNEVSTPAAIDVDWPAKTGLAIVGPNGSGKSTLLLMLAGLLEPTRGTLRVANEPLVGIDRAQIAFLPQSPYVAPDRSVRWNLRLTGYDGSRDSMLEALQRVRLLASLEAHGKRHGQTPLDIPVSELSGGERSRLALARVLLRDARLILLDEPEASLDADGRAMLRALLGGLTEGARVAVVAHDSDVVPNDYAQIACRRGTLHPSKKPAG